MHDLYNRWLEFQQYAQGTITAQMHRAGRVENYYGDLDQHYDNDKLESVISTLIYSADDERHNRPNPSMIEIDGNIRTNLASYKDAIKRYQRFRIELENGNFEENETIENVTENPSNNLSNEKFALERDMQRVLRESIEELEEGLSIIDDGAERYVTSGRIDITAQDRNNQIVVIELKAGKARGDVIGQILGYMGDIITEEIDTSVRGIIVASDFDQRVKSAARVIPNLSLKEYKIKFKFTELSDD